MVYKCNECEAIFTTMAAMKRHEKGHQKIKEQNCDICSKEFSRKEHMLKHRSCSAKVNKNLNSQKIYQYNKTQTEDLKKCNECNKILTKKSNLKRHLKTHLESVLLSSKHSSKLRYIL